MLSARAIDRADPQAGQLLLRLALEDPPSLEDPCGAHQEDRPRLPRTIGWGLRIISMVAVGTGAEPVLRDAKRGRGGPPSTGDLEPHWARGEPFEVSKAITIRSDQGLGAVLGVPPRPEGGHLSVPNGAPIPRAQ